MIQEERNVLTGVVEMAPEHCGALGPVCTGCWVWARKEKKEQMREEKPLFSISKRQSKGLKG